jgi:hypothetical protein
MLVGGGGGDVVFAVDAVEFVFGSSPVAVELEPVAPLGTLVIVLAGASLVAASVLVVVRGVAVAVVEGEAGLPGS